MLNQMSCWCPLWLTVVVLPDDMQLDQGSGTIPEQKLYWLSRQKAAIRSRLNGGCHSDGLFLKGNCHADHIPFEAHDLVSSVITPRATAMPCT